MSKWIRLAVLAALMWTPAVGASPEYKGERQRESVDSLLRSLFEQRMARAPQPESAWSLAHLRAPISPSFHLLKVTGAKTSFAPLHAAAPAQAAPESAKADPDPKRKFEYLRELRMQFEEDQRAGK